MVPETDGELPLFVDLDGTLIATDTLRVSLILLARRRPWLVPLLPIHVLKGRAWFKDRIARWVAIDPANLCYHRDVLSFIEDQRALGRRIILATAANVRVGEAVASHLKLFHEVIASDDRTNLKGASKLRAILDHLGHSDFEYVGDSMSDLPILYAARRATLVNPSARLRILAPAHCRFIVTQGS
jgi:phosphoserine phosphatase